MSPRYAFFPYHVLSVIYETVLFPDKWLATEGLWEIGINDNLGLVGKYLLFYRELQIFKSVFPKPQYEFCF